MSDGLLELLESLLKVSQEAKKILELQEKDTKRKLRVHFLGAFDFINGPNKARFFLDQGKEIFLVIEELEEFVLRYREFPDNFRIIYRPAD